MHSLWQLHPTFPHLIGPIRLRDDVLLGAYREPTPPGDPDVGDVRWPRLPSSLVAPYPYLDIGNELSVKYELHGARMRFWQWLYDEYFTTGDTPQSREPAFFKD